MNNIINIENSQSIKTTGSSLKGYVDATYEELCKAFGEPTYKEPSGDGKVTTEWNLEFELVDNTKPYVIGTIYDWKRYDNGDECRNGNEFKWNVGGMDYQALELIEEALSMFRARAMAEY